MGFGELGDHLSQWSSWNAAENNQG